MWFIRHWNVAGALHSPKGITFHSNNPQGVIKAVFSLSLSFMPTYQYPLARSSEVNHWAPWKLTNISVCLGFGIKVSVVNAHTSIARLLIDYHYGCRVWTC